MSLAGKLAFQVDRGAQFRGSELFQSGAVQVTAVEPEHVHATVAGGQQYEVCVQFFNQELLVSCECEYFRDRGACKHIWAVILEADRRGALPGATALRRLSLLETTAERKGDHPGLVQTRRTAVPKAFVPPPPPPPPPPAWQTELTAIQSELAPAALRPATWPAQFELIYVADTSSSRSSGGIVLEVKMRTRKKTGDWSAPKEFKLAAGQLELVPDPEDAQLLTMLVGGVETYSYSYAQNFSFNLRKTLPGPLALRLLPRIAATGRLFATENSGYSTNLEPLGWDDGEAWRLWLEVRQDDRDQWKITGSLRRGEERMPLTEPDLLLSSGLLLARGKLARFEHAGGFGWVSQLRRLKPSRSPTASATRRWPSCWIRRCCRPWRSTSRCASPNVMSRRGWACASRKSATGTGRISKACCCSITGADSWRKRRPAGACGRPKSGSTLCATRKRKARRGMCCWQPA